MDRINRWQNISPALLRTLDDLRSEFQQVLGTTPSTAAGHWAPAIDVFETESELLILVELPGVKQEDLQVQVEASDLILSGDRPYVEPAGTRAQRIERTYGSFRRVFQLPMNVNRDQIRASLKDGVLTLRLPKIESGQARAIPVSLED